MVRRFFSALLFTLCLWVNACWGMCPEYQAAMAAAVLDIYYLHPAYRVGGELIDGEIDCSKLVLEAMKRGGIPGLPTKIQAWVIFEGKGIWKNRAIAKWEMDNEPCDLIFQHFPGNPKHPYNVDHVLIVIVWNGIYHIVHASPSAKTVVIRPLAPWVVKAMVKNGYRRLLIGEK